MRSCCPCKRGREVTRTNGELKICRCPCDHAVLPTEEKTIARLAAGKCTRCGAKDPEPGKRRCTPCIAGQKRWTANQRRVAKAQDAVGRAAVGLPS